MASRTSQSTWRVLLVAAAALGAPLAGCAGMPREPQVLPTVGESFPAPYDAVWEATLRGLGVVRTRVADKAAGRIETEPFPYTYFMTRSPARSRGPVRLAALTGGEALLAQSGGSDNHPTQVVWISLHITLSRLAAGTLLQVEPWIHDALLTGFTPGPTNNPWVDLFGRIRESLGTP